MSLENGSIWIILLLLCALFIIGTIWVRSGTKDILVGISIFYFYFTCGPVINFLSGAPIYRGIVVDRIFDATLIFVLALLGMLIGVLLFPLATRRQMIHSPSYRIPPFILSVVFTCAIVFASLMIIQNFELVTGLRKSSRIAGIGSGLHYRYLLVQLCLSSFYFISLSSKTTKYLYFANIFVYIIYCVVLNERDFIFILASIVLHRSFLGEIRSKWQYAAFGLILVYGATFLFNQRADQAGVTVADVLNQGSLLFINTMVVDLVPGYFPHEYGATYINTIKNMFPSWLFSTAPSLTEWFRNEYTSGNNSSYGFGLDAEAYINFGYIGVPTVFFVLTSIQRFLCNHLDKHPFFAFFSVYYTASLMYAFRSESLGFVKGSVFAIAIFVVVYMFSQATTIRLDSFHDEHLSQEPAIR